MVHGGVAFSLAGSVSIHDVDGLDTVITANFTVSHGTLNVPFLPQQVQIVVGTGDNDPVVVLSGPIDGINVAIRDMFYVPDEDWDSTKNGAPDLLEMVLTEKHGDLPVNIHDRPSSVLVHTVSATVPLIVSAVVNHNPNLRLPGATYVQLPCDSQDGQIGEHITINILPKPRQCERIVAVEIFHVKEDEVTAIPHVSIEDTDDSSREFFFDTYEVTLSSNQGLLTLKDTIK
jgi:hypothetical protein